MRNRFFLVSAAAAALLAAGCSSQPKATTSLPKSGIPLNPQIQTENQLFLNQQTFDPWVLSTTDPKRAMDVYLPSGVSGTTYASDGVTSQKIIAGRYKSGVIQAFHVVHQSANPMTGPYSQTLDLETGKLSTRIGYRFGTVDISDTGSLLAGRETWSQFWKKSDILISGDPEAQQVTHANMFYLAGSAGTDNSIPPMGLSSAVYKGHIFWDAEIWMFPALIAQHPDLAKGIIDYRFKRLAAAEAIAKAHGRKGAEYPWESAATGKEEAPAEFARERHITADVAYAAWQYYLWTGDKAYLGQEGWPVISACAQYWASRVAKGPDGKYHIKQVIGPDETAGLVDDDAWTNGVVAQTLRDASLAAKALGRPADPAWDSIASHMALLADPKTGIYLESKQADARLMAKQADTQMLIYPLNVPMTPKIAGDTLDYCLKHTISVGPAMTSSINAVIAARLGRAQQSLDLFRDSYRPFMRGPWDAFSEKRTRDNVYFCTGMGGCLQAVIYGFGGLNIAQSGEKGAGTLIAQVGDAALYADPHLPPGWSGLTLKGVQFRGKTFDIAIGAGNVVKASPAK